MDSIHCGKVWKCTEMRTASTRGGWATSGVGQAPHKQYRKDCRPQNVIDLQVKSLGSVIELSGDTESSLSGQSSHTLFLGCIIESSWMPPALFSSLPFFRNNCLCWYYASSFVVLGWGPSAEAAEPPLPSVPSPGKTVQ